MFKVFTNLSVMGIGTLLMFFGTEALALTGFAIFFAGFRTDIKGVAS